MLIATNRLYKYKSYWLYTLTKVDLIYLGGIKNINKRLSNRVIIGRFKKHYTKECFVQYKTQVKSLEVATKVINKLAQNSGKIPIRIFEVWITKEELLNEK